MKFSIIFIACFFSVAFTAATVYVWFSKRSLVRQLVSPRGQRSGPGVPHKSSLQWPLVRQYLRRTSIIPHGQGFHPGIACFPPITMLAFVIIEKYSWVRCKTPLKWIHILDMCVRPARVDKRQETITFTVNGSSIHGGKLLTSQQSPHSFTICSLLFPVRNSDHCESVVTSSHISDYLYTWPFSQHFGLLEEKCRNLMKTGCSNIKLFRHLDI